MKTRKTLNPERLYYLRDARQVVGNCLLWWGKGRSGYTCNLDNAHLFTESEAYSQHKSRASDIPYPKDLIDGLAYRHVDHQVTDCLEWIEENQDAPQYIKEAVENIAQQSNGGAKPTC